MNIPVNTVLSKSHKRFGFSVTEAECMNCGTFYAVKDVGNLIGTTDDDSDINGIVNTYREQHGEEVECEYSDLMSRHLYVAQEPVIESWTYDETIDSVAVECAHCGEYWVVLDEPLIVGVTDEHEEIKEIVQAHADAYGIVLVEP